MADAPGAPADAAASVPPLSGETSGAPAPKATTSESASGASGSGGGSGAAGRAGEARVRGRPAAPTSSSSGGSGPPARAPYDPPGLTRDAIVARRLIRYMISEGLWTGGVPPDLFADQVAPEAPADAPELAAAAPEGGPDGPDALGIRSRSRTGSSSSSSTSGSGDEQDATGGDF